MGKYAEQMKADIANVMADLDDFAVRITDASGVTWDGTKDAVNIDPALAIDGVYAGHAFVVYINLASKPSIYPAAEVHAVVTVDSDLKYEVVSSNQTDNWTLRLDLRTLN